MNTAVQGYVRTAMTSMNISLFALTLKQEAPEKSDYNSTRSVEDEKMSEFTKPFPSICCAWHAVLLNVMCTWRVGTLLIFIFLACYHFKNNHKRNRICPSEFRSSQVRKMAGSSRGGEVGVGDKDRHFSLD